MSDNTILNENNIRNLQLKELEILIYFSEFCEANGLRFYLAGGTLLGAVRHKGFIPWDDDVDIHMPRPDYDKLPELWEARADTRKYTLGITTLEKNYRHHAYTIVDNETTYIEKRNVYDDIAQGVKIDVIPLDGAPEGKIRQKLQLLWAELFAIYNVQRLPESQRSRIMRAGVRIALFLVKSPKLRYKIWTKAEREMKRFDFDSSPYIKELVASFRTMHCLYPRKSFTETKWLEFEGKLMPAHFYYEEYLRNVYYEYMDLPPIEQRKPKSDVVFIDLENGYKKYKGIYYCINK